MSVVSFPFIIFFFMTLIIHWILPQRFRNAFLLAISWGYLATWNVIFLLFLIFSTTVSFLSGRLIAQSKDNQKKRGVLLSIGIIILLGSLIIVKYTPIMIQVLGISFFTFQAVSYIIDVYRGDIEGEKNFVVLALYIAFFPQLASGPIAKAKEQIRKYKVERFFDLEKTEKAIVLAIYGIFMKLVIADRIAIFVDNVYSNIETTGRAGIILAVLLYSIQIYCDFAGYTLIAIGVGRSFGIELPVNFRQPYLSRNMNDFWKRWHISLTSWFRDYLYFPLGGNKKGKVRTYINVMMVFVISGIWHGVGLTFILWGFLHGVVQVLEKAFVKTKCGCRFLTYTMVSLLWVLFRSDTISQAGMIFERIVINANGMGVSGILSHGLNMANMLLLVIAISVMSLVDIAAYRNINLIDKVFELSLPVKWMVLYTLIFSVLIFGIYGPGYDAASFIYDKF